MSPRKRPGKPLGRQAGKRPEYRTVVIFTEGENSEPDYVNGLKALPEVAEQVALKVEVRPSHGVPMTLVKLAKREKEDPEVDECWCLFDVEWPKHHPNIREAVALAKESGVGLAVSNPCFELWLVLHFKDYTKFTDTAPIESVSRKLDGRKGKGIDAAEYMGRRGQAVKRARALAKRHEGNGTGFPDDNPSSGMHLLLASLEAEGLSTPAKD